MCVEWKRKPLLCRLTELCSSINFKLRLTNTTLLDLLWTTEGADKSLARPTSRCIFFDGENFSFDANLVIYIYIYIYTHTHTHTYTQ